MSRDSPRGIRIPFVKRACEMFNIRKLVSNPRTSTYKFRRFTRKCFFGMLPFICIKSFSIHGMFRFVVLGIKCIKFLIFLKIYQRLLKVILIYLNIVLLMLLVRVFSLVFLISKEMKNRLTLR